MRISLIIPYTYNEDINRLNGLNALFNSIDNQSYRDFEVIVVEDTRGRNNSLFPFPDKVNLIKVSDPKKRKFNKAWLVNVGGRKANTDNLLFMDAEMSFEYDFMEKVAHYASKMEIFNCWNKLVCEVGRDNPVMRLRFFDCSDLDFLALLFSKRDFFFNKLGGANENYFGYGGEDNDTYIRLKFLSGSISTMDNIIHHHYHHWSNELGDEREFLLNKTKSDPRKVIDDLISAGVGKLESPTTI